MLITSVIHNKIHDQPHTPRFDLGYESFHVLESAVPLVDALVVPDVVPHVVLRESYTGDSQIRSTPRF